MSISPKVGKSPGKIFIVEEKRNPSTDYFVLPAVNKSLKDIVRADFSSCPDPADMFGATIIFVRYVPQSWARLVDQMRAQLCRVIFFFDDDLLDLHAIAEMPWHYRLKLFRLAAARKSWLRKHGAELWVSTPYLQQKYADWHPRLVLPGPVPSLPTINRRFFYHGSATHMSEIQWLKPIVETLLKSDERFSFEIIGDHEINRLFREIPRVTIVHPMSWPAYQNFLALPGRHVGMAPLLDRLFNKSRSYTKFFDITRCGAVGVYPRDSIYSEVITNGIEGLLAEQNPSAWLEALLSIASDEPRRQNMLRNAEEKIASLTVES